MDEVSSLPNSLHLWDEINNHVLPHVCCFLLIIMSLSGKKHGMGKWPKHSTNPWRSSHIEVDPHEKLMPSWSWSHAEMGGGPPNMVQWGGTSKVGFNKGGASTKMKNPRWQLQILVSYELRGPQRRIMSGETMAHCDSLSDLWVFTLTLRTCVLLRYEVDKN